MLVCCSAFYGLYFMDVTPGSFTLCFVSILIPLCAYIVKMMMKYGRSKTYRNITRNIVRESMEKGRGSVSLVWMRVSNSLRGRGRSMSSDEAVRRSSTITTTTTTTTTTENPLQSITNSPGSGNGRKMAQDVSDHDPDEETPRPSIVI